LSYTSEYSVCHIRDTHIIIAYEIAIVNIFLRKN